MTQEDYPPDFRALCAELHEALEKRCETLEEDRLLNRSAAALRAALAEPEPQGSMGRSAIEPVPVAERLPGPEDCDGEGRCWLFHSGDEDWQPSWWLGELPEGSEYCISNWLPHHALPVPKYS